MFGMSKQTQQIECAEARHMVENHGAQLVDVRTPEECAKGVIPGSVNIPLHHIQVGHETLDKNKPVIVYCMSGRRSAQAQSILQSIGFDNVHNLGTLRKYLAC